MSEYRQPPVPDPSPAERRTRTIFWGIGGFLLCLVVVSLAVLIQLAIKPPSPEERAKIEGPDARRKTRDARPNPRPASRAPRPPAQPAVPPPVKLPEEREVPMSAQAVSADPAPPAVATGFTVTDEFGSFTEPETPILTSIDGKSTITLQHLWEPGKEIEVPVTELKLVAPKAKQTKWGACIGRTALAVGRGRPRNRLYYRNPRVACAAYTAAIHRKCGHGGLSFSATAQYGQLRKRGWKVVASRVSTRYVPYLNFYRPGDMLYFHKGRRYGHTECYVGKGLTSGTSSSEGRVGIRRLGNRGFKLVTVIRG